MNDRLIPARALFRFRLACRHYPHWMRETPETLDERYLLPALSQLEGGPPPFAEFRLGWCQEGLILSLRVIGKRQRAWCRDTRIEESDGLQLYVATRATRDVHRATRFCHRFIFLPSGGGPRLAAPVAEQLLLNRAKENARPVRPGTLKIRSQQRVDGYLLDARIPAAALTGFDPDEEASLAFNYSINDRELGWQTLGVAGGLPFQEDPSLWVKLDLVKESRAGAKGNSEAKETQ